MGRYNYTRTTTRHFITSSTHSIIMAEKINTTQPKSYQWMPKPENRGNVPAGLEYIDSLTSIHLKQKIDKLEVLTGWQVKNKFRLTDPVTGQVIGLFKEESDCFQRQCCKN